MDILHDIIAGDQDDELYGDVLASPHEEDDRTRNQVPPQAFRPYTDMITPQVFAFFMDKYLIFALSRCQTTMSNIFL